MKSISGQGLLNVHLPGQIPESNNVQALNQLESAMRLRDDRVGQLMVDPLLDPLRKECASGRSHGN